jgi:hypothetical protein
LCEESCFGGFVAGGGWLGSAVVEHGWEEEGCLLGCLGGFLGLVAFLSKC